MLHTYPTIHCDSCNHKP